MLPQTSAPNFSARDSATPPPSSRRDWLAWAGTAALGPLLPACGGTGNPGPAMSATMAWGRNEIRQAMLRSDARAASVALLHGDRLVWQEAFGVLDDTSATPATPDTRFNVGSVSKVLAALAVMVLVDRQLVQLDAPVVRYLPRFTMLSEDYRDITVRHLLSHASGLPGTHAHNMFSFAPLSGYAAGLEAALAGVHLKHAPGALATYCNDGFTLVERIVLAVTGQSYPAFVQSVLFNPLAMARSGYTLLPLPEGSFAHGYIHKVRQGQEFVMGYATGGLCTTPGDMMKLAAMLLQGGEYDGRRIVSKAAVLEMGRDQGQGTHLHLTPDWHAGLGWDSTRHQGLGAAGVLAWQKSGSTMFYASDFHVLPQAGLALLLTGSASSFKPGPIAEGILLRALQETGQLPALPPKVSTAAPALATSSSSAVDAVLGIYGRSSKPLKVLSPDSQQIDLWIWSAPAKDWAPLCTGLRPRSDGWWWSDAQPRTHYRWEMADGRRYLLSREPATAGHYWVTMPVGQQMPRAAAALPAQWISRLDSTWLLANEASESIPLALGVGAAALRELPELPGYLFWDDSQFLLPLSPDRAGMAVQVPLNDGRDLVELVVETRDKEEWMHAAGWAYRRQG
ncbi:MULTISPECIES: serine hydrolase [unclassified Acidovorax]|uniref:serine hydrolase domain-containing protein n=1 Tax=unclassified Acidovorax TaxID=2684926 RepID=UPI001C49176C|nr:MULTISPECIES: serine hydrolase domain-containing protein [unclassified Acidovorax]MBV7430047.1 beta-lactamase family protein [Acidovorax sp. sif0732]MBV7451440.1 beta-lactamase family protein [Acidovorax sp. sif0715]